MLQAEGPSIFVECPEEGKAARSKGCFQVSFERKSTQGGIIEALSNSYKQGPIAARIRIDLAKETLLLK